jgi:hypothetical protein
MLLTFAQRARAERFALPAALTLVLALPPALLHARAVAEILIALTCALFLVHAAATRDWRWLRSPFAWAAAAWWLWQIVCSAIGTGGLALSLVAFRLPLFALAVGWWVLGGPRARRALWWVLAAAVLWIGLEAWQQYLTGRNLFGAARWDDGALTGPFNRPRAGPALILTLFPVLVPASAALIAAPPRWRKAAGIALAVLGAATLLLIGQRMPSALLLLGLVLTAALLPRLRLAVAAAAVIGVALLAATPVLAPATYGKLIVHTQAQLAHFAESPYGEIWVRAAVLARQHPWTGQGFDAFRRGCADPRAIQGLPELGVTQAEARQATEACNIHPHNYYLEEADDGGLPLLALFTLMVAAAWLTLARGLTRRPDPLRAGLLVGYTLAVWPIASTSALTSMPNAGWIFLLLGYGFALSRQAAPSSAST